MAGTEIVQPRDLEPMLGNPNFNATKFLELYEEWKKSDSDNRTRLFATLRGMHQNAGYKNKAGLFEVGKIETEMHEIAAIVTTFQAKRGQIIATTATATADTASKVTADKAPSMIITENEYPDRRGAIIDSFKKAVHFPFSVRYTHEGQSYEMSINTDLNQIKIGDRSIVLSHPQANIQKIYMDKNNVHMSVLFSGKTHTISLSKEQFQVALLRLIDMSDGIHSMTMFGQSINLDISGNENPRKINTPQQVVEKGLLDKISAIKKQLDENLKLPMTPIDLRQDFAYINENIKDPLAKQMAVNLLMNHLAGQGYIIQIMSSGIINVTPDVIKNATQETATGFESSLNSALQANFISRVNIEESLIMLTGGKWSDYVRSLAKPSMATATGYAAYIGDIYGIDMSKGKNIEGTIKAHKAMTAQEKAFLLSHTAGQITHVNVGEVSQSYVETVTGLQELQNSKFFAITQYALGNKPLTPEEITANAESLARGSIEGENSNNNGKGGYGASWALGLLVTAMGLGWSKGKGFEFGTLFSRLFKGLLGFGVLMLGCAANKEQVAHGNIDTDLCKEGKELLKSGIQEAKAGIKDVISGGSDTSDSTSTPAQTNKLENDPKLTLTQNAARKKIEGMSDLKSKIAGLSATPKNAPLEKYIEFTRSLESQKLSVFVSPSNPEHSIFSTKDGLDPTIANIPSDIDPTLLKRVIRTYLVGEDIKLSQLKPNNLTWDDYRQKYNINKTFGEATQFTYGTINQQSQSSNTINEDAVKQFSLIGVNVDILKTQISKDGPDFIGKYTINSIPNKVLEPSTQTIYIQYDSQGNLKTTNIKITAKAPIGSGRSEITYTLAKNGNTITFS